ARRHADGGEVHRRQLGDRQRAIREPAEQHQRRHQDRRRDRPADEDPGDVHCSAGFLRSCFSAPSPLASLLPAAPPWMFAPGASPRGGRATMISPGFRPSLITTSPPTWRATVTLRSATTPWSSTVKT